jgi:hypothetical protein
MSKSKKPFEIKTNADGTENPKYVDLLNEYPTIPSQTFGCYSFVSPEKIIKQKEMYYFDKFVKQWNFTKSVSQFSDFLQFVSFKYNVKVENLLEDFKQFVQEEENVLKAQDVVGDFATFIEKNEDRLIDSFQKEHGFQTSVRGFVNIGNFPTSDEAEIYAKKIRESVPHHDILVGRNFVWTPLDPDAYKTGRIEFMEDELNQLHSEKIKNEEKAKEEFERRVKETNKKAIEENIKLAQKSGNKFTQAIDEQGNLVGVKETVDFESREVATEEETKAYNDQVLEYNQKKVHDDGITVTQSE